MTSRTASHIARVLLLILMTLGRASAQTPQDTTTTEPDEESAPAAVHSNQQPLRTMILTLSLLGAGADDTSPGAVSGTRSATGYHNDANALLTYAARGQRSAVGVSVQSVVRYDPARGDLGTVHDQGTFDFSMTGARTRLRMTQSLTYSPAYQFGALSDTTDASGSAQADTAQAHGDYANADLAAYASATRVDFTRELSRRASLSLFYTGRHTAFPGFDSGFTSQAIGFQVTRRISRNASLHTGYGYQVGGGITPDATLRTHDLDIGIDYGRALTLSKHTTVSFGTGSSVLTDGGLTYRLSGDASLTRRVGRTGHARLTYRRGVRLLEGFAAPVMFDTVDAGLTGSLSRRVALSSSAGLTSGTVGTTKTAGSFGTITGAAGLHMTLSRRAAFEAQYFYYRQRAADTTVLPPGLAGALNRQGLRAGITWGAPLLR